MRQFKFRVWDKITKEFTQDRYYKNEYISIALGFYSEVCRSIDDFVLHQYTGLKDSKGKEIYEGDILTSSSINGFRFLYRAEFYEGSFLKPYIFRQMADGEPEVVGRANNNIDFNILTVVGNIFCDEFKMLD